MAQTEAQRRAALKYTKEKVVQLKVNLYPGDQDIIDHLAGMEGKADYIRRLIRDDMDKKPK